MGLRWPFSRKAATPVTILDLIRSASYLEDLDPVQVVREAYKQNPDAFAAVQHITTAAKAVPWLVQKRLADGSTEDAPPGHDVAKLLREPNPWHPWEYVVEHFLGSLILTGNAFAVLNGPAGGRPREILPLPRHLVTFEQNEFTMEVTEYKVQTKRGPVVVPPEQMVHVHTWNPEDPFRGQSKVQAAAASIDLGNLARKWNRKLLGNMARPSGSYVTEQNLTDPQYERLRKELKERYQGAEHAGTPMLLEGGVKWERTSLTPEEMDWSNGLAQVRREVAVTLGVAPELLGDPVVKTYANALHARLALYEDQVFPLLRHVSHTLTLKLRPWWPDLALGLDVDQVPAMQERRQEFAKTLAGLVTSGIMTPNEAREALGYEKVPGADELLAPISLAPLGAGTDPAKPAGPDEEEPAEERSENGHGKPKLRSLRRRR